MNRTLHINGQPVALESLERSGNIVRFQLNGKAYQFSLDVILGEQWLQTETEKIPCAAWQAVKGAKRVQCGALEAVVSEAGIAASGGSGAAPLSPQAPMPGVIRQVLVKKGESVAKDQPLLVMEAMKLQMTLSAGDDATVDAVLVEVGQMVTEGAELVKLTAAKK